MVRIAQASIDERGKARGGAAGNQTGKELNERDWYDKGWQYVLRHPNDEISRKAAEAIRKIVHCPNVGYDQDERNTLHLVLKSMDYDLDKYIGSGIKTEVDCSSLVTLAYLVAGVKTLEYVANAPSTHYMNKAFMAAGFKSLTDSATVNGTKKLKVGDVLLKPGSHTCMVVEIDEAKGVEYYPKYTGTSPIFVSALGSLGIDYSKSYRKKIAEANGIQNYTGTEKQNLRLFNLLKEGKLIKC